ncbi:MAG: hypothetical protein V3S40_05700 [Kiloniellales bacterium]
MLDSTNKISQEAPDVSHASNPAIRQQGIIQTETGLISDPAAQGSAHGQSSHDAFLNHYFKRLDPEVAASFTAEQREAIKIMFGSRGIAKHAVEVRRSVPFGRLRFYVVFLLGREQRGFPRVYSQGLISRRFSALFYLGLGALCMAPVFALLYSSFGN